MVFLAFQWFSLGFTVTVTVVFLSFEALSQEPSAELAPSAPPAEPAASQPAASSASDCGRAVGLGRRGGEDLEDLESYFFGGFGVVSCGVKSGSFFFGESGSLIQA